MYKKAPVVEKVDNVINWINLYLLNTLLVSLVLTRWIVIYPWDSAVRRLNNRGLNRPSFSNVSTMQNAFPQTSHNL